MRYQELLRSPDFNICLFDAPQQLIHILLMYTRAVCQNLVLDDTNDHSVGRDLSFFRQHQTSICLLYFNCPHTLLLITTWAINIPMRPVLYVRKYRVECHRAIPYLLWQCVHVVGHGIVSGVEVCLSARASETRRDHLGLVRDVFWIECEDELVLLYKGDSRCERRSMWERRALGECLGCGKDWAELELAICDIKGTLLTAHDD